MKAIINEQIIIITEIYTFIHTKLQSNYCNENELDIHDFNTGTVQTIATFTVLNIHHCSFLLLYSSSVQFNTIGFIDHLVFLHIMITKNTY